VKTLQTPTTGAIPSKRPIITTASLLASLLSPVLLGPALLALALLVKCNLHKSIIKLIEKPASYVWPAGWRATAILTYFLLSE